MAPLKSFLAALALVWAAPCAADPVAPWRGHIAEASARFGVPAAWIERVLRAESGGRTRLHGRPIVSRAGAMGLMQLMPDTWAAMRARLGLGSDPHDPRDNILAGTLYLRLMYDRFGYPGFFGAYNAGPARYAAWEAGRGRLPAETRAYLATVAGDSFGRSGLPGSLMAGEGAAVPSKPQPAIFFALGDTAAAGKTSGSPTPGGLFVTLDRGGHDAGGASARVVAGE